MAAFSTRPLFARNARRAWRAQYGIPRSKSAPGAPQKKKVNVPGRPWGQRQLSLVNSSKFIPRTRPVGRGRGHELFRLPLFRRRTGKPVGGAGKHAVATIRTPCGGRVLREALAAWSPCPAKDFTVVEASRRRRNTLPSTAERDMPPRRMPMAAAVSPSAQSFFSKAICSSVHALLRIALLPNSLDRTAGSERRWSGAAIVT
jgi:hypothetical protein